METQHWITTAVDCGYLERNSAAGVFQLCLQIGRMIGRMKAKADQFCPKASNRLHEPDAEFFGPPDPNFPPIDDDEQPGF